MAALQVRERQTALTRAPRNAVARRLLAIGMLVGALGAPISASPAHAGGGDAVPSASLSTPAERAERAAGLLELLAVVPGEYDQRCLIQTRTDLAADPVLLPFEPRIDAALQCIADDGVTVFAYKLADAATVDAALFNFFIEPQNPNLAGCESEGTWGEGRWAREVLSERRRPLATVAWTAPDAEMLFATRRVDGDLARVNTWWESPSSPPLSDPPPPDELVSDHTWQKNAKVLRRSVPKRLRRSCDVPAISEAELGPLFRDRLVLRTVLHCDPRPDTRLTVLDFRYRENSSAYVEAHVPEDAPVTKTTGVDCPGVGYTSSHPKSDDLRLEYVCFVDAAGQATIVWKNDQQGIALRAVRTDGDLEALERFYSQAGPVPNPQLS